MLSFSMPHRILCPILLVCFLTNNLIVPGYAQAITALGEQDVGASLRLPNPGEMTHLSPQFNPPMLKGIKVHPDNPFRFDFILDIGDSPSLTKEGVRGSLKEESTKLIKYFLASITVPEKDLWVNLSPYEKDLIIPKSFGLTEMGRDLLAEDYMLKQITASLIYPEEEVGKKFWKRIYAEAAKKYGTTNIPVNTFNKVWIIPEKAVVYENAKAGTAYVVESKLKVMLEEDYLSLEKNSVSLRGASETSDEAISTRTTNPNKIASLARLADVPGRAPPAGVRNDTKGISALGSQIVREIVIPELTTEVNEGKNFAQLRQVYNSLILATWYKKKIKDSILAQVYADKNKVAGITINDVGAGSKPALERAPTRGAPTEILDTNAIYQRYLKAFKKGVYNYIKEEQDPITQEIVPRKYFSGGEVLFGVGSILKANPAMPTQLNHGDLAVVAMEIQQAQKEKIQKSANPAMMVNEEQYLAELLHKHYYQSEWLAGKINFFIKNKFFPSNNTDSLDSFIRLFLREALEHPEKFKGNAEPYQSTYAVPLLDMVTTAVLREFREGASSRLNAAKEYYETRISFFKKILSICHPRDQIRISEIIQSFQNEYRYVVFFRQRQYQFFQESESDVSNERLIESVENFRRMVGPLFLNNVRDKFNSGNGTFEFTSVNFPGVTFEIFRNGKLNVRGALHRDELIHPKERQEELNQIVLIFNSGLFLHQRMFKRFHQMDEAFIQTTTGQENNEILKEFYRAEEGFFKENSRLLNAYARVPQLNDSFINYILATLGFEKTAEQWQASKDKLRPWIKTDNALYDRAMVGPNPAMINTVWKTTNINNHDPRRFLYTVKMSHLDKLLNLKESKDEYYSASLVSQDYLATVANRRIGLILDFPENELLAVLKHMHSDIVTVGLKTLEGLKVFLGQHLQHTKQMDLGEEDNILFDRVSEGDKPLTLTPEELIQKTSVNKPSSGYTRNNEIIIRNTKNLKVSAAIIMVKDDEEMQTNLEFLKTLDVYKEIFAAIKAGLPVVIVGDKNAELLGKKTGGLLDAKRAFIEAFPTAEEISPWRFVVRPLAKEVLGERNASNPAMNSAGEEQQGYEVDSNVLYSNESTYGIKFKELYDLALQETQSGSDLTLADMPENLFAPGASEKLRQFYARKNAIVRSHFRVLLTAALLRLEKKQWSSADLENEGDRVSGRLFHEVPNPAMVKTPDNEPHSTQEMLSKIPDEMEINGRVFKMVPLTKALLLEKPDDFFRLQNSIAANVTWTKERDVIGIAQDHPSQDGPIKFNEGYGSYALMDYNKKDSNGNPGLPVAETIFSRTDNRPDHIYLETLAVLPELQGQGLASWLLLKSFAYIRQNHSELAYASWRTRKELDKDELKDPRIASSANAVAYYEKIGAERDEGDKHEFPRGEIPPDEQRLPKDQLKPGTIEGRWHVAFRINLNQLDRLYKNYQSKLGKRGQSPSTSPATNSAMLYTAPTGVQLTPQDVVRLNQEAYSAAAFKFDQNWSEPTPEIKGFMDQAVQEAQVDGVIVDAGTAAGKSIGYFNQITKKEIVAVDNVANMLEIAKKRYPRHKFLNMDITDMSPLRAEFPNVSLLWADAVLLHFPKELAPKVLKEFKETLAPGGVLALTTKLGEGWDFESNPTYEKARFFTYYQEKELKELLTQAGFVDVKVRIQQRSRRTKPGAKNDYWIYALAKKPLKSGERERGQSPSTPSTTEPNSAMNARPGISRRSFLPRFLAGATALALSPLDLLSQSTNNVVDIKPREIIYPKTNTPVLLESMGHRDPLEAGKVDARVAKIIETVRNNTATPQEIKDFREYFEEKLASPWNVSVVKNFRSQIKRIEQAITERGVKVICFEQTVEVLLNARINAGAQKELAKILKMAGAEDAQQKADDFMLLAYAPVVYMVMHLDEHKAINDVDLMPIDDTKLNEQTGVYLNEYEQKAKELSTKTVTIEQKSKLEELMKQIDFSGKPASVGQRQDILDAFKSNPVLSKEVIELIDTFEKYLDYRGPKRHEHMEKMVRLSLKEKPVTTLVHAGKFHIDYLENNLKLPDRAMTGTERGQSPSAASRAMNSYTVKSGDTLEALAQRWGLSRQELMDYNEIRKIRKLVPGEELLYPSIYKVRTGDTLMGLAERLGLSLKELMSRNAMLEIRDLEPGEKLYVPSNKAMIAAQRERGQSPSTQRGGIDLTSDKAMQVKNEGQGGIRFNMDPAMIQQLEKSPGFYPKIFNITSLIDLRGFLESN